MVPTPTRKPLHCAPCLAAVLDRDMSVQLPVIRIVLQRLLDEKRKLQPGGMPSFRPPIALLMGDVCLCHRIVGQAVKNPAYPLAHDRLSFPEHEEERPVPGSQVHPCTL